MRVLISADMEGVTGVTWPDDVEPGNPRWEYHRRFFTDDVNAAIEGFVAAGASDVLVNEAHATQRNLLRDRLDPRAALLTGRHKPLAMMEGVDRGVDAVAFVGYHAAAGEQGVLAHIYLPNTITGVWLNGATCSEGYMNAALAAEYGVPVVLVTGDDRACEDALTYAPDAELVAVKECVDRYSAICLPPERTYAAIREAATAALDPLPDLRPLVAPYRYEVEFDTTNPVVMTTGIPDVEQVGTRRVSWELPTMKQAIRCFRAVTALASGSTEHTYG
ncbi:D-aminopeptidase DppA. Metallo peptidase. MEROPS family M55 [Jatrophihabitans endophyticus]|uniref:D-aminopeptidase DppA. Metallo peptidase. MEROPS family M55 n=1 Tax=Jatrophihabitans endophyticus TaxID=1206085 RepID=A0A1M5P5K3_9ACTN|nr:M55 family metallopeptidase [Jatrophihabitans endophyticus]SHG96995.1 D-aminopeptidase DppA. Metallo peptidase. MEROPS family M55 [Jatrophihabitans endophyticus]